MQASIIELIGLFASGATILSVIVGVFKLGSIIGSFKTEVRADISGVKAQVSRLESKLDDTASEVRQNTQRLRRETLKKKLDEEYRERWKKTSIKSNNDED